MAGRGSFRASGGDRSRLQELPASADDLPETVSVDLDDKNPDNFEIVEVDDTPEDDRGRPTELDRSLADQEEDLRGISSKTQKRIERLRFETHTERRGREAAERERDAAVQLARSQGAEIAQLRMVAESGNTALVGSMRSERTARIEDASRRLAQAHADGDGAAIAKATADMTQAQAELVAINTRASAPAPAQQQQAPAEQQQQPAQPNIAPRARQWVERNLKWFRVDGGDPKSAKALSINYDLIARNMDPNSEAFTRELDKRLKAVYPDHEPFDYPSEDGGRQDRSPRRSNVVAEGSRESEDRRPANPRTVELTRSELSIAKRLGVTPQAYAAQKLKREQADRRGAQ